MKRFLSVLFLVFVTFVSYGQNDNVSETKHLRFMGIEMDGKLADFVDRLEEKGLTVSSQESGTAVLSGKFAGVYSSVYVFSTLKSNTVQGVSVGFYNPTGTWADLKSQYIDMKRLLSEKYGDPVEIEYFKEADIEGSGRELEELKAGRGVYQSTFLPHGLLDEGMIVLSIQGSFLPPCVGLNYVDGKNSKLFESERQEDL